MDTIYEAVRDGGIERPYATICSDEPLTFRVFDGEAIIIGTVTNGYQWPNKIYMGKDYLFSRGSSFMIPKSSPLKVSFYNFICV